MLPRRIREQAPRLPTLLMPSKDATALAALADDVDNDELISAFDDDGLEPESAANDDHAATSPSLLLLPPLCLLSAPSAAFQDGAVLQHH